MTTYREQLLSLAADLNITDDEAGESEWASCLNDSQLSKAILRMRPDADMPVQHPTPDPADDVIGNGEWDHYDLAQQLEMRGYEIRMDSEDNEHSEVWLDECHVGDIRGDAVATVTTIRTIFSTPQE